jgi:septal ring factor EnvC (AmiA/AmiB activator)
LEESTEGWRSLWGWFKNNIQIISIVGSVIFSAGVLYSNVNNLDRRVVILEKENENLGKVSAAIAALNQKIDDANKAQDETNKNVADLGNAVTSLDESVAKFETKIEDLPKIKSRK